MDPFWNNIYDDTKDRRYGNLFLATLFLGLPLLGLAFGVVSLIFAGLSEVLAGYPGFGPFQIICLVLLADLALIAMAMLCRHWIRTGRKARQDRLRFSNLSRDELLKARSKLKGQVKPVRFRLVERPAKPVASRAPDIDLKY
jgi:hypothetical protein